MKRKYILITTLFFALIYVAVFSQQNVKLYNVVWNSPSDDSFGSMPLGNGDIGLNVWVEKNGDLLFYISKVDAFDAGHLLPELGRIRLKTEPALPVDKFKQTLNLIDASIMIEAGDVKLHLWVDANQSVIRVEGKSITPRTATNTLESLRPLDNDNEPLPQNGTAGVLFNDNKNRLAWCYRNQSSRWAENFKNQNSPEMVAKTKDPILYRTSGCLLQANGFTRENSATLRLKNKSTQFDCSVKVISTQPESLQAWLNEVSKPVKSDWMAHCAYWKSFWNRSYIHVISGGTGKLNLDQCRFTQFAQGSKAYEFGLPPMLDAQPIAGKVTGSWIAKYGQTIEGCKAGPWPKEGVRLSAIPRKLVSFKSITGNIQVKQDEKGWLLTGMPDPLNTIVRLGFDASVEDIAYALPSKGSFAIGRERVVQSGADGRLNAEVDLEAEKTIDRFEFTIDNPGYLCGQGKKIDPIATNAVRLFVQTSEIKQLDVF